MAAVLAVATTSTSGASKSDNMMSVDISPISGDSSAVNDDILDQVQMLGEEADSILERIRDGSFFDPTPKNGGSPQVIFKDEDEEDDMKEDYIRLWHAERKIRQDIAACSTTKEDSRVGTSSIVRRKKTNTAVNLGTGDGDIDWDSVRKLEVEQGEQKSMVVRGPVIIVWGVVAVVGFLKGSFCWILPWGESCKTY